jgi:hypothetical protein
MTKKIKFITGLSHINNVLKKYIGVIMVGSESDRNNNKTKIFCPKLFKFIVDK